MPDLDACPSASTAQARNIFETTTTAPNRRQLFESGLINEHDDVRGTSRWNMRRQEQRSARDADQAYIEHLEAHSDRLEQNIRSRLVVEHIGVGHRLSEQMIEAICCVPL